MPQTSVNVIAGDDARASDFNKVVADLAEIYAGGPGVPIGGIIWWWSDNTVPLNFKVCDGTTISDVASPLNGLTAPNMIDRFIRGVANANLRSSPVSGGEDSVVLTTSQLPAHSHGVSDPGHSHGVSDPGHTHTYVGPRTTGAGSDKNGNGIPPHNSITHANNFIIEIQPRTTGISINGNGTGLSIQNTGSNQGHNNIPAYRGMVPVMRIK